ncbi:Hypothetical protein BN69_2000 [Methylocystis sp. SC2]|nr:Hypothetical protein BN69_2000 [Methylocystis sp. SC2]
MPLLAATRASIDETRLADNIESEPKFIFPKTSALASVLSRSVRLRTYAAAAGFRLPVSEILQPHLEKLQVYPN